MGNTQSSPPSKSSRRSKKKREPETAADAATNVFGDFASSIQSGMRKIEDSSLLDAVCGTIMMDDKDVRPGPSFYSEDYSEDGSRTISEDDTLDEYDRRGKSGKKVVQSESESLDTYDTVSEASKPKKKSSKRSSRRESHDDSESFISEDSSSYIDSKKGRKGSKGVVMESTPEVGLSKPLASSFAKRCYFTKAGIGKTTQHYEGLTLTGNVVLMLAGAMKLKGCPTICDEDLRRVEQTYPNQFSRLPDELLLSSGWRRISKYCHFSNNPIPDGVPFFHSKQRIHPSGGYYFLLAAAVGMVRPIEVEPLTRDTLVLLETDYPTQCDAAPDILIEDPSQWTLVDKFCFFSGGPINTEEDVYYQADFEGNLIFMLAFLSPSLTPEELYKLGPAYDSEPGLKSVAAVEEVESVYDLTERDFDDLKLYHLGPCRALPQYILQPNAWTKVLPPRFLSAKQQAMMRAQDYEQMHGAPSIPANSSAASATNTSAAAIGTEASTEAVPPQAPLSPEEPLQAPDPSLEEASTSYTPPAQESAPVPPESVPYTSEQSQAQSYVYESTASKSQFVGPDGSFLREAEEAPNSQFVGPDGSFLREVEEEGAFVDSTVPIDEAIDARRRNRAPKHRSKGPHSGGPRDHGSPAFVMGSEAGTSYTGSSYVDSTPRGEPPSLAPQDAPDDEGRYQDEFTEPSPRSSYTGHDVDRYDAEGDVRSPSSASNGYFQDGTYYSDSRETGGSSEFFEREEEYYDSPEKGNIRVHTALEKHGEYGQSPDPGSQPGFIYSQESGSEFSGGQGGYRHEDEGYDESQADSRLEPLYSPNDGSTYDLRDGGQHTSDTVFSTPDDGTNESAGYRRQDPPTDDYESAESPTGNDYSSMDSPAAEKTPQQKSSSARSGLKSSRLNSTISPRSEFSAGESASMSEYSQTSAMRGAQELLKKNRQKRLEMAMKKKGATPTNNSGNDDQLKSPADDDTSGATSFVSGSSVWTDTSGADRGSRRALILQMAKARMKGNQRAQSEAPIAEEPSIDETSEQESKTTAPTKVSDIELAGELD